MERTLVVCVLWLFLALSSALVSVFMRPLIDWILQGLQLYVVSLLALLLGLKLFSHFRKKSKKAARRKIIRDIRKDQKRWKEKLKSLSLA